MRRLKLAVLLFFLSQLVYAKDTLEFTTIDGSAYAVISERVLREAYKRLGIDINVSGRPAPRAIHEANIGRSDGELYRIKNIHKKYPNLLMVSVPVGIMEGIALTTQNDLKISDWKALSPHRVCIRNGVKFAEAGTSHMKVNAVSSNDQLFSMLGRERCDVIIIARLTSIPMTLKFAKQHQTSLFQSVVETYPLYHYLHKKNADLKPKLEQVLYNMQKAGIIRQIRNDYIAELLSSK